MSYLHRSHKLEYLDIEPAPYTLQEYHRCLKQLGRIGRLLGGDKATLKAFSRLQKAPRSILDVGCGGGDFTVRLARVYPEAQVVGIDLSSSAIDYARAQSHCVPNVAFECPRKKELHYPNGSFDVVTCTLVCHHMSDPEVIDFITRARKIARQAVIINDLHRHRLATLSFALIAPVLFPNRLILHDGLLSIRRAFTRKDWERYLRAAEVRLSAYQIGWSFAFRWIVTIRAKSTF